MTGSNASTGEVEVSRLTAEEARTRMEGGEPIAFVDSRSESSWNSSGERIPGSVRVPPDEAAQRAADVPRDRSVITFCT